MGTTVRSDGGALISEPGVSDGPRLLTLWLGTAALAVAASLLSPSVFYGLLVPLVCFGVWQFLSLTHADDRLGRSLGVLLALGHSATIWYFEHEPRVLVPAQSLLPLSALFFTLLRPGLRESAGRRATGVAFAPLWVGLLTYLAVARRAAAEHGAVLADLALITAALGVTGAALSQRLFGVRHPDPLSFARVLADGACAIVLALAGGVAVALAAPNALPLLAAVAFAAVAGGLSRVGRLGQALIEASLRGSASSAPPKGWILDHLSAVLLTSALAYGFAQVQSALGF
jgi:hypothetical protein